MIRWIQAYRVDKAVGAVPSGEVNDHFTVVSKAEDKNRKKVVGSKVGQADDTTRIGV